MGALWTVEEAVCDSGELVEKERLILGPGGT